MSNLTKKASKNSLALILQQVVIMLTSFLLTPILFSTLGSSLYGIWQLIVKWTSYIVYLDGRSHENLKWEISRSQDNDENSNAELYAASFFVWVTFLPVILISSILFVLWISDISSDFVSHQSVLLASILMCINAILLGVQRFPEGILNGSNKGYKSVSFRLILLTLNGFSSYVILEVGYGIIGFASVQVITTLLMALCYYYTAKNEVNWFSFATPKISTIKRTYRRSFWFFAWSVVNFGLLQIEVLLLGSFSEVENVSKYVITFYAIQMVTVFIATFISGILPSIGSLIGKAKFKQVADIRRESALYSWWFGVSLSVSIIVLNRSFVELWVSKDAFAGVLTSFAIVLTALQTVMLKNDSLIINLALEQKEKVKVTTISLGIVFALGWVLIPSYGIIGVCIASILGRSFLMFRYPKIINGLLKNSNIKLFNSKSIIVSSFLLGFSLYLSYIVLLDSWVLLLLLGALIFTFSLAIYYFLVFSLDEKLKFKRRLSNLFNKKEVLNSDAK